MKFTPAMYTDYASAVRGKYRDKITVKPELGSMVTFSHSMKMPYHRWFYYKQGFSPEFVEYCLRDSKVEPFSRILDPFCGSGTTALASLNLNRNCITTDVNPDAVSIAQRSVEDHVPHQKVSHQIETPLTKLLQ